MKRLLLSMLCMAGLTAVSAQTPYEVSGKTDASANGKTAVLYNLLNREVIDSVKVANGTFSFKKTVNEPTFGVVRIMDTPCPMIPFFLDKAELSFEKGKAGLLAGSATNEALKEFNTVNKPFTKEMQDVYKKYNELASASQGKISKAQEDSIDNVMEAIQKKAAPVILAQITKNVNNYAPVYMLLSSRLSDEDKAKALAVQGEFQKFPAIVEMKAQMAAETKSSEGNPYIDFTMNDLNGTPHKLSEYVGKGKYVLIDFWASWCGPCRREMPNVIALYKKYKDKGFDIVGISLDSNKNAWQNAISQMGMPWHHLSDLKGWKNSGAKLYGVNAIPSTRLVDPKGNIIGKDLRGEELAAKLAEIFK